MTNPNWFPGTEGTHYAGVAIPEVTSEVEIIDCPDCNGKGSTVDPWPARVNRPSEEQAVTCTRCEGRGEVEALCDAGECDEPRKAGDSLCAECIEVREDARATYRQPYSKQELDDAYSHPTEQAKRNALMRFAD